MTQVNFSVDGKTFKKGWYTMEYFNNVATYWLVYDDTLKNTNRINNSCLMLQLFNELPAGATINAHL